MQKAGILAVEVRDVGYMRRLRKAGKFVEVGDARDM